DLAQSAILTADETEMIEIRRPSLLQRCADLVGLDRFRLAMASDQPRYLVVVVPDQQQVVGAFLRHHQNLGTVSSQQGIADAPAFTHFGLIVAERAAFNTAAAKHQRRQFAYV